MAGMFDDSYLPGKCPICGKAPLVPLSIGYKLLLEKPGQRQPVGGVFAYKCAEEGHVFFVMLKDVEEAHMAGE